jgi:mevalonate kinase
MNATLELLKFKIDLTVNHTMIKETEIVEVLGNELPEMNPILEKTEDVNNIYKAMQCFANFTKSLVNKGDFKEVKHCFNVAENLLKNGNSTVKNAIENGYLYSLSSVLDLTTPVSVKVKSLLTDSLKKEYKRQVCSSGI